MLARTGRFKEYIRDVETDVEKEKRVFPTSCTVYLYDNDLPSLLNFVSSALKRGAGVKVHLEKFVSSPAILGNWQFTIDPAHPDFDKLELLNTELKSHYIPLEDATDTYLVQDSLEDGEGCIQQSWGVFAAALREGRIPCVDLSLLRPAGTPSSNRLIATGAFGMGTPDDPEAGSFVSIYHRIFQFVTRGNIIALCQLLGQINSTIRQGRERKTGIVCTALKYDHPDIKKYLSFPLTRLVGSQKKGIRLDAGVLKNKELVTLICQKVNTESLFLEKIQKTENGEDIYSNVCEEILLLPRATCVLSHVNAGMIKEISDIPNAIIEVVRDLIYHWKTWRRNVSEKAMSLYLPLEKDRQIGVGFIGWANFLGIHEISYAEFTEALKNFLDALAGNGAFFEPTPAEKVVMYLYQGYQEAADLAKAEGLERVFTLAPTQSVAFEYQDVYGNTCSRAITAPFSLRTRRASDKKGSKWVFYGKYVETALDVGSDVHETLHDQWQRLMNTTGMAHTISYDLWHNIDETWLQKFILEMNLQTTYYNFASEINPEYLDKGNIVELEFDTVTSKDMPCGCAE